MTFRAYSGAELDLEHLQPADLQLQDIARALSHICRFGGHVRGFHSVAAHSVLVSELVWASLEHLDMTRRRAGAALGLLHDASEAYLGDVVRPLKYTPLMAPYVALEARVMAAVWDRFGLSAAAADQVLAVAVKAADDRLCRVEQRDLQGAAFDDPHAPITLMRPVDARTQFLERAALLGLE